MRRTKIIATLGPACSDEETIQQLLTSGVDVFRLNFSHGTAAERVRLVEIIRHVATEHGKYVPIMGDIQGPKLRIGEVEGVVHLLNGATFTITTRDIVGNAGMVSTPFDNLPREVQIGHRILINDGLVELVVTAIDETKVATRVLHGGPISSRKGMNFPDTELTIPAVTEKDREDVRFAVEHQLDYIAASFIRRRSDIVELRELLQSLDGSELNVIAKLEKAQAIDALEADKPRRPPLFMFFPTISTHTPFRPTPPYQPDWKRVLTDQPFDQADLDRSFDQQADWLNLGPSYVDAMAYTYATLSGYLRQRAGHDVVMILLGDHQPPALVSGEGAPWDVPVHVITGRRDVLDALVAKGFRRGLTPSRPDLSKMNVLLPILLDSFARN